MEPVYSFLIWFFRACSAFGGHKVTRVGPARLPREGGGVVAVNHTSYLDFTFVAVQIWRTDRRRVRFMAKSELQENPLTRYLIRKSHAIPVDRHAARESYDEAVRVLRSGELVVVYPEATIGRSFEIKTFKTGAARMALEAGVPIHPVVAWGCQRIITKGYRNLGRTNTPVTIAVGEPIIPRGSVEELTTEVHVAMEALLRDAQDAYGDHPAGEFWVPERLGGGAMSLEDANEIDRQVAQERARKHTTD